MNPPLAHEIVGDGPRLGMLLHGILGSRMNWKSFGRRLVEAAPEWRMLLVDLRNHGDSPPRAGPNSLAACARDLGELCAHLGEEPAWLSGHSFGGKVALTYAADIASELEQLWVLDSAPGMTGDGISDEVQDVIQTLHAVELPIENRRALVDELVDRGLSLEVARWMTTNVRRTRHGFTWRFDLDAVEEMLASYAEADLWSVMERPPSGVRVDVVRGASSSRWREADVARLGEAAKGPRVGVHVLEDAGHWVHTDNPEGLFSIMRPSLG